MCVGLLIIVWNLLSEDEKYSEMGCAVYKLKLGLQRRTW